MTTQLSLFDRDWINIYAPLVISAMAGREFTCDDVHEILPAPDQLNHYGALLARLRNQGLIEKIGYRPSNRSEANGRVLAVWRVKP